MDCRRRCRRCTCRRSRGRRTLPCGRKSRWSLRCPASASALLLGFDSVVEFGGVDHGAAMASRANLLEVVEGAYCKFEAAALDLCDFGFGARAMAGRGCRGVADFDRHADRTFAGIEVRLDGVDC